MAAHSKSFERHERSGDLHCTDVQLQREWSMTNTTNEASIPSKSFDIQQVSLVFRIMRVVASLDDLLHTW
jgi:hypothetical protein